MGRKCIPYAEFYSFSRISWKLRNSWKFNLWTAISLVKCIMNYWTKEGSLWNSKHELSACYQFVKISHREKYPVYSMKCNVLWLLIWIGICQYRKNRLAKIENKIDAVISQRQLLHLTSLSLLTFYFTPGSTCPHYCLFTCIKWRLYKKKHGPVRAVTVRKQSQW